MLPGRQESEGKGQAKLKGLLDCGVRCIVNLMEEDEFGHDGESFVEYERTIKRMAEETGTEIECIRIYPRSNCPFSKTYGRNPRPH